jgi:hypothetical protein
MLFGLTKRLTSQLLSRKVKCLIYKILLRPVLTGGSNTLAKDEHGENLLRP